MAKNDDLFTTLRKQGLRKSVAKAIAEAEGAGRRGSGKAQALGRDAIKDLNEAAEAIRARVVDAGTRSTAGQKAAATRKRNAATRSAAAKQGATARKAPAKKR
jgi:hypothetical protein